MANKTMDERAYWHLIATTATYDAADVGRFWDREPKDTRKLMGDLADAVLTLLEDTDESSG